MNKGLSEYEILPDNNTIALTLFRAVGWLARGDLLTRIGDAGPIIFTPDVQCLRQMTFEYALYFHQGDYFQGGVYQLAKEFNVNLKIIKTGQHKGRLKDTNGFLSLKSKNNTLQVTAIKRAQEDEDVILRLFNPSQKIIEEKLIFIYGEKRSKKIIIEIEKLLGKYQKNISSPAKKKNFLNEKDVVLITYADNFWESQEKPLVTLNKFLKSYLVDTISLVHLLPFYPYSSDDGFSVIDYKKVNPVFGVGRISKILAITLI